MEIQRKLIEKYESKNIFELRTFDDFTQRVINNQFPVIVMYYKQ
jgi:hypothetical protein